jgi:hypothetical protein
MATYLDSRQISFGAEWIWGLHGAGNVSDFQPPSDKTSLNTRWTAELC